MNKKVFTASQVLLSEKSNDIFLFVTMRMLSTRVNRNNDAVTADFIDEVVSHQETYLGLPVYADTTKLLAGDFDGLGHMYNRVTGKFKTTQVGSLSNFEKVEDEYGVSLLAEARFPKREAELCEKIMELYDSNKLNFSFEISYMPDAVSTEDGVLYIQADEHNMLTGLAIVSVPAYEEAVALSLVAEDESAQSDAAEQEGVETMNKDKMTDVVEETIVAEETSEVTEEANAEQVVAEEVIAEEAVTEESEQTEEVVAEAEAVAETEPAQETAQAELPMEDPIDPDIDAAHMQIEAECHRLRAKIVELEAQLESMQADHLELEAIRAERRAQELANRQNNARTFAEQNGLDVEAEEVANAIAELNFEKLAELAMSINKEVTTEATISVVASMNVGAESLRDRLFDTDM